MQSPQTCLLVLARLRLFPSFTIVPSGSSSLPALSSTVRHYQQQHSMTKDRFRAKPVTKYTPKNWQALNEREDDQIAPKAAARSIDALQRWALHTANISQGSHKPKRNPNSRTYSRSLPRRSLLARLTQGGRRSRCFSALGPYVPGHNVKEAEAFRPAYWVSAAQYTLLERRF